MATATVVVGLTAPSAAQDAGRDQVILVLDGSGSMWGQIDGVSKIEIARAQVAEMLSQWDAGIDLGLIAYGHRERGACGDIEAVLPPGPVDPTRFAAAVNGVSPLGKTPLSASVRLAAETMRYSEEKATVILLSDGLENCDADPCALGRELAVTGIDFTAHVIGFDLGDTDASELQCLAEATGGEFLLAGDAASLTQSLQRAVAVVFEPEPEPEVIEAEIIKPEPDGPLGIRARVRLCENCEILADGVFWRLEEPEVAADGAPVEISVSGAADARFDVPPGEYQLRVAVGDTVGLQNVTVGEDGFSDVIITLGAATVRVRAFASEGGTELTDDLFFRVLSGEAALDGSREQIAVSGSVNPVFTLPPGQYVLRTKHGDTIVDAPFEAVSGDPMNFDAILNVGYARVEAIPTAGAQPLTDNQYYRVYNAQTDLAGNRVQVAVAGQAQPLFRLPAGDYVISAKHGDAYAEQAVTITADSLTQVQIDMNLGYLDVKSYLAEGLPPLTRDIFYTVFTKETDLAGNRQQVAVAGAAEALIRLNAGDYLISSRFGIVTTFAEVSLPAGTRQSVNVIHDAGIVRATAVEQEGGPAINGGLLWTVLTEEADLSGQRTVLFGTGAPQPQLQLKAGGYILQITRAGEVFEFPVSINPGEVLDLTLLLKR